ncbi:MAG: glycosyltransferase family 4 protein [Candidatus Bathyarchaeota archaeon]|nr:glycosyltransferase family 4 protein [Candidatus Bathyarchaeota archaeon]
MIRRFSSVSTSHTRVAYLSTYPPRECGIATFTKDLIDAVDEVNGYRSTVIAINEKGAIYDYDRRVKWTVEGDSAQSYVEAAEYINSSNIELVNIQHEFGLYGGECGEDIKVFMETVQKPVVTTLHTIHDSFSPKALAVLKYVSEKSAAIVVITHTATKLLRKQGIRYKNCLVIPHGCPNIEFTDNDSAKESLGLKNRLVASTFGLISSGKGIEYAIRALPKIVEKEPRLLYLVIGQTHPEVRKHEGERYRNKLMTLVNDLGLYEHVRFDNRYLSKRELIKYLQATDIYLTPYVSPNQISSGTLTYALGAGKAVVSTPYFHAQDTLANNRGLFFKFKDPDSIAESLAVLLDDNLRRAIQKRVYKYSRRFLWTNVAKNYVNLFNKVTKTKG